MEMNLKNVKRFKDYLKYTYNYCVVNKKASMFKKMLRFCDKIGLDEEAVGILIYISLSDTYDMMIEESSGGKTDDE